MKVALAGFGQEGKASYDYWNRDGNELTLASEADAINDAPEGVATITGPDAFTKLGEFDRIIRTPGVNPHKLPYGDKVWSATNEFFEKCPAPIIGVTGTKGKGTTSSLIASILKAGGKTVHLVGNIGVPALTELTNIGPDDVVVFEISSFQLWDIRKSPHIAVVLGIEADHLDVHDSFDDYVEAKRNIVRYQKQQDVTIFYEDSEHSANIGRSSSAGSVIAYPDDEQAKYAARFIRIPGQHNIQNACAAMLAASYFDVDEAAIQVGLTSFSGLPHRIKFIREYNGTSYYDDSYSSAPAASIAALRSFTAPKILLLGGYEKHADFTELARFVKNDDTIKKVILMGQTRNRIMQCFEQNGVDTLRYEITDSTDFKEIVAKASEHSQAGDVVLLSPGSASFDMFKNFTDRGEQFISIVNAL